MKKSVSKVFSVLTAFAMLLGISGAALAAPMGDPPAGEAPSGGDPMGGGASTGVTTIYKQGDWKYSITTTTSNGESTSYATIAYYYGSGNADTNGDGVNETIIVPSVLGGVEVTNISELAFNHLSVSAVYVPDTVTTVDSWAFYDLNSSAVISFANAAVSLNETAFQSCNSNNIYLPNTNTTTTANNSSVKTDGTTLTVAVSDVTKTWIGGGTYFVASGYPITEAMVSAITVTDTVAVEPVELAVTIADSLADVVEASDVVNRFRVVTSDSTLLTDIAEDSSYGEVADALPYEIPSEGTTYYYLNGDKVTLAEDCAFYDLETGEALAEVQDANKDSTPYQYCAYEANDAGEITAIYYSEVGYTYNYNSTTIAVDTGATGYALGTAPFLGSSINGLTGRDTLDTVYLSFANAAVETDGADQDVSYDTLEATTAGTTVVADGTEITASSAEFAAANEERSILWANNDSSISVGYLDATSDSVGNWAKMSYEYGEAEYNVEVVMEWGMNAVLYATNGGQVVVGDLEGDTSTIVSSGDGANGVIVGGTGTETLTDGTTSTTSRIYVYNTDFTLTGWNSHVADAVYGGYAYLEAVNATTGKAGSYAVGQASSLANDFGNGVIDVKDYHAVVYGNRSAGVYAIGSGVISAENSSLVSMMDAALVSASGGTVVLDNSSARGQIVLRSRGGNSTNNAMRITDSTLTLAKDYLSEDSGYSYGDTAAAAVQAWETYVDSDGTLMHYVMSSEGMTIGEAAVITNADADVDGLISALNQIEGIAVTADTEIRNSVLDNSYYNYSAGQFTGTEDFSDVPFLQLGATYGGLSSSIMEFEAAGETMTLDNVTVAYDDTVGENYHYLVANETGSTGTIVNLDNSTVEGIIWNEGDVTRASEGRTADRSSEMTVNLVNTTWTGVYADGSNGLWDGDTAYTNADGETTYLNGNYYGAEGNYQTTLNIDATSTWIVTGDSYVGTLNVADGGTIKAETPVTVYYQSGTVPDSAENVTFVKVVEFSDMTSDYDWAETAVTALATEGIVVGVDDTSFDPGATATLQEYILALYRACNTEAGTSGDDAALTWAAEYLSDVGLDAASIDATASITRETAMALTAAVLGLSSGTAEDLTSFTDASAVSSLAVPYVAALVKAGVAEGDDTGMLNPAATMTRAEMAVLIYRALSVLDN